MEEEKDKDKIYTDNIIRKGQQPLSKEIKDQVLRYADDVWSTINDKYIYEKMSIEEPWGTPNIDVWVHYYKVENGQIYKNNLFRRFDFQIYDYSDVKREKFENYLTSTFVSRGIIGYNPHKPNEDVVNVQNQLVEMNTENTDLRKRLNNMEKMMELVQESVDFVMEHGRSGPPEDPPVLARKEVGLCCIKTAQKGAVFCDCGYAITDEILEALGMTARLREE